MKIKYLLFPSKYNMYLIYFRDFSIKLIDIRKLDSIYKLDSSVIPHYCECNLSLTTDKKYFATGSTKGEVYIFDSDTGKLEERIDNKSKSITSLAWRPYHSQLYVGDSTGFITVWGI